MAARYIDERLELPNQFTPGKIGVVTVLYNSATVLEDFFHSIDHQHYCNFIVYCVDNASADDSVAQCRARAGRYTVIENGINLGVAAGNNIGTKAAIADGCEFVLYLNNDVVFGPELFDELIRGLAKHHCSMTTPMMYYHDRPNVIWAAGGFFQPWLGYRCLHSGQERTPDEESPQERQVSFTPTCCVLVHREMFAEIGLMDERYFVYYDDTDFMLRAWKREKKLYLLPRAGLWHKVSSLAGKDSTFRTRYVIRNHALYTHKNVNLLGASLVSAIYCSYFVAMWVVGRATRKEAEDKVRYWIDGIRLAATAP